MSFQQYTAHKISDPEGNFLQNLNEICLFTHEVIKITSGFKEVTICSLNLIWTSGKYE
jgi:hypothetical protein